MTARRVVIAIPCHRDEPGIAETVRSLAASATLATEAAIRVVVCVNGQAPTEGPAAAALVGSTDCTVQFLDVASKPAAWNVLRQEPADVHVFADADIRVDPVALPALLAALGDPLVAGATGAQAHEGAGVVARVARVPHRLAWGGLLGTLYAVRTDALPEAMPADVILDDAWLFGHLGQGRLVSVPEAMATVQLPSRWRDLWRQRVRAERGKQQLRAWAVPLATPPQGAGVATAWRAYPPAEWPYVIALASVKAAAALRAKFGEPRWDLATTTKR